MSTKRGKWTKPPFHPATGRAAKPTDPGTWTTFEDAPGAYNRGGWDGIGFVVRRPDRQPAGSKEGDEAIASLPEVVVFDLDDCLDPVSGDLKPWAAEVVAALGTYAERSPSGRGLRLVALGRKRGPRCRKGDFEMYDDARYVTITGWRLENAPTTVEDRQRAIDAVYESIFGQPAAPGRSPSGPRATPGTLAEVRPPNADDRDLVEKAHRAASGDKFARLWGGAWEGWYPSQSEADLALCALLAYWTDKDPERIDRLFRHSGLLRDKWDELRGEQTYGEKTIALALGGAEHFVPDNLARRLGVSRENLTDVGNARRLVASHGGKLRYCHTWRKWLVWDGRRWRSDDTGDVWRLAKETLRELLARAAAEAATVVKELETRAGDTDEG